MDKKLEQLKKQYMDIPIPNELDFVVKKALNQRKRRKRLLKCLAGTGAAAIVFVIGINSSPTIANAFSKVPVVANIVKVFTFREFKIEDKNYHADLKVPAVANLENKSLENGLNQKYLEENKKLYADFKAQMDSLEKNGGGHLGIDSGYQVKTNNEKILSISRYVVNTVGSSSTTLKFDTIDKQKQILITLPSLFKDDSYIAVISNYIKEQMIRQMKADPGKVYWVSYPGGPELTPDMEFKIIAKNQNFYINKDGKLVISFNKYDVAPGYMGTVEFTIPTDVISNILVSNEYIK
ncbi:DUF3298 domain-containing protein [Aneurinibacillus thermoaerophilus]|uniref:DUF3298 and DUF4163 domain-containing protein n=1 Tax=Aneurinibacillus thermoaerophilus TaxID=143495 RepID=UPI002E2245FB|nr:DUF3298 domain-containing protein [Aneurinibacillus thermoaerophilus]MED0764436.1 DUF3298 domain-containing protein [Aneurinibacillus thermoaerophilus]